MNLTRFSPKQIGWEPYLHLVWLVFLVFQPIFDPTTAAIDWIMLGLVVTVFLPIYFWNWTREEPRQQLYGVLAITTLGLVFVWFNSGASGFFIYAAAAAAFIRPLRLAFGLIVGLLFLTMLIALAFTSFIGWYALLYFLPIFLMIAIIGGTNVFYSEKERANAKLRMAQEEVEHLATIAERERIARDLHDLLGHTLSVITLKSELAAKLVERDPVRAAGEMQEVEQISRQALSEVRAAVRGYRSKGLRAELVNAKLALETAGIKFDYYTEPLQLAPAHEGVLALALREAVTNVIRHAQATRCAVRLSNSVEQIRLEVEDNGVGGQAAEGSGLQGMRERVEAQGGRLERDGTHGTLLAVVLPHHAPKRLEPTPLAGKLEPST